MPSSLDDLPQVVGHTVSVSRRGNSSIVNFLPASEPRHDDASRSIDAKQMYIP